MAKRRHAAALFEVFHDTRGPSSRGAPAWRGFLSWFRGRGEGSGAVDPNDPTTTPMKSPLIMSRSAETPAPAQAPTPARKEIVEPPERRAGAATAAVSVASATAAGAPTTSSTELHAERGAAARQSNRHFQFHLDRDRREVMVRVQFTTAVVACAAIVLAVALSYVLGRKAGTRPAVLAAETPADTRNSDVKPSALELPRRASHIVDNNAGATVKPPVHSGGENSTGEPEGQAQANGVHGLHVPPPPVPDGRRIIGLNYYIIQTYPNESSAVEARDFLLKNGVGCTAEKVPHGFGAEPTWFAVITTHGFDRDQLHTPDCENLKKQIDRIGEKFASTGRFKRFLSPPPLYKLKPEMRTE